jgi:hypothetical protein
MPTARLVTRTWLIALFAIIALLATSVPAGAQATFQTLYNFQEGSGGNAPDGSLIFDASGALYGTAENGGNAGCRLSLLAITAAAWCSS